MFTNVSPQLDALVEILVAFVLSSVIGVERQLRQKSAGLRTHTLVGLGTALFVEAGKRGFHDVLPPGHQGYDPSRIAAQIVSGLGFIGGGLIFVRSDAVRGLTTAAGVWVTAAVAMTCAAGLPWLAVGATALYFVVAYAYTPVVRLLSGPAVRTVELRMVYRTGRGVLREALVQCTSEGFQVADASVDRSGGVRVGIPQQASGSPVPGEPSGAGRPDEPGTTTVVLHLEGAGEPTRLVACLEDIDGVLAVSAGRPEEEE